MHRFKLGITTWPTLLTVAMALFAGTLTMAVAKDDKQAMEQIALTEDQVKNYIKIAPKLAKMFDRIDKAGDKPNKKLEVDLETLAKKGGFKSFGELEAVSSNINFVMTGMNDEDGSFTEPAEVLKQELKDTKADKGIKAKEKKQMIASIKESIKSTPKLAHPGNVPVIKKHIKALSALFNE